MELGKLVVREPESAGPLAPVTPSTKFSPPVLEADSPMSSREKVGYAFWGVLLGFILVTESLAAFWHDFPIPTISGTVGNLEQEYHRVRIIVTGGIVVLAARITFYPWPFTNRQLDD